MITVAIIGPDGAGKTTVTREVAGNLPMPAKFVYMGVNLENSTLVLPTTRLLLEVKRWRGGRPDMAGPSSRSSRKPPATNPLKRLFDTVKLSLRLGNLAAEEWFKAVVVKYYQKRGYVVLFDRHFFIDYYASDVTAGRDQPLPNRVHGWMLKRLYPRPDVVICLDAPADVLFARKGESTPELLEARRQEYLELQDVLSPYYLLDATQPLPALVNQVRDIIVSQVQRGQPPAIPAQNHLDAP